MTDEPVLGAEIPLSRGKVAVVDQADMERVMAQGTWYAAPDGPRCYAVRTVFVDGRRGNLTMHRFILGASLYHKGMDVDHIDGDGLNNQRHNLRICRHVDNLRNRGLQANNTSGWKGVSLNKASGKWVAHIKLDSKRLYLGCFDEAIEAARAYAAVALEHHGDFANIPRLDELFPGGKP